MSVQKAKDFLEYVIQNPELAEKLKGFDIDELRQAVQEFKLSSSDDLFESNQAVPILPI